jgi:hypothetical protein
LTSLVMQQEVATPMTTKTLYSNSMQVVVFVGCTHLPVFYFSSVPSCLVLLLVIRTGWLFLPFLWSSETCRRSVRSLPCDSKQLATLRSAHVNRWLG